MMKNNNNNTPFVRKKISPTLLAFSAIALLLLASSPLLLLSNPLLLQPVQAQTTTMTFKTPKPAIGSTDQSLLLTFDAQGNSSTPNPSSVDITNGTIQWQAQGVGNVTAEINGGNFNNRRGGQISLSTTLDEIPYTIQSECSTSERNIIYELKTVGNEPPSYQTFTGPVECSSSSSQGGGNSTTQSSSSPGTTTTTQDIDGDGIPDSSDRCTHNSNPRCFKEGGDTSTTTNPQESSSSTAGNQTR